jgi:hypothetical protein
VVESVAASGKDVDPWELLTAEQKIGLLRDLVFDEMAQVMPRLLKR